MSDNQRMFAHPKIVPEELAELHARIFKWWRAEGRVLPWREKLKDEKLKLELEVVSSNEILNNSVRDVAFASYFATSLQRDPYQVVVAEMMLQQTQVERVLPKYTAWLAKWPTTAELAKATLAEVLILWQGLGYNRRAKFLWELARQIEQRGGFWPTTEVELLELPGIGKYTARAVMSFAMGQQVGVVDTNIKRVMSRFLGEAKDYFFLADNCLPAGQADPWNQAIMDLGAMICTARAPQCSVCPVKQNCQANLTAQQQGFSNFSEFLKSQPAKKSSYKSGVRFEDTDRFFRGRMMDLLRADTYLITKFAQKMEQDFGLIDHQRFQKLVDGLAAEKMITIQGKKVRLG